MEAIMACQNGLIFLNRYLEFTDDINADFRAGILDKLVKGEKVTIQDMNRMTNIADGVKAGIIVGTFHMLNMSEMSTMDEFIKDLIVITDEGGFRSADDLDVGLLFNIPIFIGPESNAFVSPIQAQEEEIYL
jgi:hypothetical protein